MTKVNGFNIPQMLEIMKETASTVSLEIDGGSLWRCCVHDDAHGEFEMSGSMTIVVKAAFEPYRKEATKRRDKIRKRLNQML